MADKIRQSGDNVGEAVKELTKRKRPDRSEAMSVHTEPGDNTKYITHSMHMWGWTKPDMTDNAAVTERVQQYFQLCADDDMKPSVAGIALAFGVDRKTFRMWVYGQESKYIPDVCRTTIKKAYSILNVQMEDYMQNGKINPVAGIFLMKNNMQYEDRSEVILTPNSPLGSETSQKELEDRIGGTIPADAEEVE